jgi:dephospho-CoA kinase
VLWIGLTGGIASGKSTVTKILRSKGYSVIDADELAREVTRRGSEASIEIGQAFGPGVIDAAGEIDRPKLGSLVFSNPERLAKLESIIHPRVRALQEKKRQELETRGEKAAFYDVPLLFEKNMASLFDRVVAVICPVDLQIQRLMARNQLTLDEAKKRIHVQVSNEERQRLSNDVIQNAGTLAELEAEVDRYLAKLLANTPI